MSKNTGQRVLVYGAGGHARSVADVLLAKDPSADILFVDENPFLDERILGFEVRTIPDYVDRDFIVAVGDNQKRRAIFEKLDRNRAFTVFSPLATIGWGAVIGKGCFLGHHGHIGPEVYIGENTILNTASILEHESRIGAHCHIAPNVMIAGRCEIGDQVFIGAGAVVLPKIRISSNVVIGAGSVVNKDLLEPGVYVGTPIRKI